MRGLVGSFAALAVLGAAHAAAAAPSLEIDNAALQVVVSPEPRSDISIEIVRGNPRLPLRSWTVMDRTFVDGDLAHRIQGCGVGPDGQPFAEVSGVGRVPLSALPKLVIHTPLDARVTAGGEVWGEVGAAQSLELGAAGCGAWRVGDVRGALKLSDAGSGGVQAGRAGSAELSVAGSGSISVGRIGGPVRASDVGSGSIDIAGIGGPFNVSVAGSGHVRADSGAVPTMQVSIAGSGGVALNGVAGQLSAQVMGSGDVDVARVTGPVNRAIMGSGAVRVGS